ncbi:hypothetical protein ACFXA3_02965 [Streptomyces sp. NPDC059456]|uniref:hypothetical protein n=1 Tax=Streptomyces sp. NPDC059456 TaxID=3346838 RepID=UPI0036A74032
MAAGLAVLSVSLLVLPGLVVDHDPAGARLAATDRLNAVNDVRTTLLQAIGGRWSQPGRGTVEQLGSDKLDVRIGGIYARWRLADRFVRDHEAVDPVRPLETRAADAFSPRMRVRS